MVRYVPTVLLPRDRKEMAARRKNKFDVNLNDEVEKLHHQLWDDDTYYRLLEAVDDSAAMEGSTVVDDILAAQMLKQLAASEGNSFVASTPLASLVLSLRVVLRRYELSRKERRMKVGDVAVKGNGDTGSVGDVGAE